MPDRSDIDWMTHVQWTSEEVADGIEEWLKIRRDEYESYMISYQAIDQLLDELRDKTVEGWLPWQRLSKGEDE